MSPPTRVFDPDVAVVQAAAARYPEEPPFHPHEAYPEYAFGALASERNEVYASFREGLRRLGLDSARYGTREWNPLGELIRPGDDVVVKPNLVQHVSHGEQAYDCIVVHASVLRAVIDYALIALGDSGRVTIADAPLWDAEFDRIVARTRLDEVLRFLAQRGRPVGLLDLRRLRVVQKHGLVVRRELDSEMTRRSRIVDLGDASELAGPFERSSGRLHGTDYDRLETVRHHRDRRHEYCLSQVVLDADVVLNVAKLKTHRKAGVTLSMKNLVGMNVDKNFLPHYRIGTPAEGGDELPDLAGAHRRLIHRVLRASIDGLLMRNERVAVPILLPLFGAFGRATRALERHRPESRVASTHPGYNQLVIDSVYRLLLGSKVRAGSWEGNDTIWRTIVDLNKCLFYVDREGRIAEEPVRRCFSVVDGIVGGELEGPVNASPRSSGALVLGWSPYHVDRACVQLMGFDETLLPFLGGARRARRLPLVRDEATRLHSNRAEWCGAAIAPGDSLRFRPHPNWPSLAARS